MNCRLLDIHSLILAGDLNFLVGTSENWENRIRMDPLASWFLQLMNSHKLVDDQPKPLAPTWKNGRSSVDVIAKRLDRILVHEDLYSSVDRCVSSIEKVVILDHFPVLLRMRNGLRLSKFPFKYCPIWCDDAVFTSLVRNHWTKYLCSNFGPAMVVLPGFLGSLKNAVVPWIRQKKIE